jgi:glycine/D-amino acid oxidase-like deaminating enzyme/nitrite reductase/ring-hydroxylating ferredoxin subunit
VNSVLRQSGKRSLWSDTVDDRPFPRLGEQRSFDAAVVGAGIVGLTAALRMKEAGLRVAVLEARAAGAQVTGCSTAKITAQHSLTYRDLIERHGRDKAQAYADANQHAVETIVATVRRLNIECGLERKDAYVFSRTGDATEAIQAETEAAASLGLPAEYLDAAPIAVPVAGAMRFSNQAQFNPRRYASGLAEAVDGDGSAVFEHTRVLDVEDGEPCRVETELGTVEANDVVVATNIPILDRGGYFARAFPRAHIALAARIDNAGLADGMFICLDGEPRSARVAVVDGATFLIVLSESFVPGEPDDTSAIVANLEAAVRRDFPIQSIDYRWMTEDYDSMDGIPFAGKLTPLSRHVFTATGFSAWGISNGTAVAEVLADAVVGRQNRWAGLYDSTRPPAKGMRTVVRKNARVGADWIKARIERASDAKAEDLAPGQGAIVETAEGKRAVFRNDSGVLMAFSPYCSHLKCPLSWNSFAATWDCSCHGSRFTATGDVLHGPAIRSLRQAAPPEG